MSVIYACDVGTTLSDPPNFGWVRVERTADGEPPVPVGSRSIEALISSLKRDFDKGNSVALGLESPCFLPIPREANDLSRGRTGDGNRSCFAPVGAAVTTLGLHQATWILGRISSATVTHEFTTDWRDWPPGNRRLLLLWEAFVSGPAHSPDNNPLEDAATAAVHFLEGERDLSDLNSVTAFPCLSLIHAAALWSGWTEDVTGLDKPLLVIRPDDQFQGEIGDYREPA